jgi:hypothetical protein
LVGIEHKSDLDTSGEILEDKVFLVFKVENIKGVLRDHADGTNVWMTIDEIIAFPKAHPDMLSVIDLANQGNSVPFTESEYIINEY